MSDPGPTSEDLTVSPDQASTREYTLEEVAALTAMTPRNVRAYSQRGLLPPVLRRGRTVAYTYEHVTRVRLVRGLTQHGLSLRQVHTLVERGSAASELARLAQEQAFPRPEDDVPVPLNPGTVAWYREHRPGVMEDLQREGVVHLVDGVPSASATGLGLVAGLLTRGHHLDATTQVSLTSARAAAGVADDVRDALAQRPGGRPDPEEVLMMVQLAVNVFTDGLRARATGTEPVEPAEPGEPVDPAEPVDPVDPGRV